MDHSAQEPRSSLSVPEMLRIMDVATALRQDRELIEEQLNLDALKARLRDRMLAAAEVTGEAVSPEEVDAAIDTYYARLHTFREPKLSFPVVMAHLWVLRKPILIVGGSVAGTLLLAWWLFVSSYGPYSEAGKTRRRMEDLLATVNRREQSILAVAKTNAVNDTIAQLQKEAQTFASQNDAAKLANVDAALADLEAKLLDEYTVSIVATPGRKSGIDRYYNDESGKRISGYYLIVEAKRPDGQVIPRTIHNSETNRDELVESWGERVPKAVYERIGRDKKDDGILQETAFAVKTRGTLDEEMVIRGEDGQPLSRLGQITQW